ncbi:MAG: HlyD family secretion protein [Desulfobulbaceae bacterium]|jgi:membrane fusion protein (multidrug efflux system)|nr:HlyD family secretion protein [Desulfobulbaceae bacterium]
MKMNRKKVLFIAAVVVGSGTLIIWAALSWSTGMRSINTDNAYIHADIIAIAPKVSGYVMEVPVRDNMSVKVGDLLFAIDERDYTAKVEQAKANVLAAESAIANVKAATVLQHAVIRQAEAQVASAAAIQKRAAQEYARQNRLRKDKATTEQRFEDSLRDKAQTDASLAGAQANLDVQTKQLDVLTSQLSSAHAGLAQAQAALSLAVLDLEHCRVRAPVDGVIGNRKARIGRFVTPGTALLDLVPVQDVWIVANFKETQMEHIRIGQNVRIAVDGYPGAALAGVVDSLAPGSGSSFSLLPPDNATGNFIRVVQRVPVKITLKDNTLIGLLVPGLSVRVTVLPGGEK